MKEKKTFIGLDIGTDSVGWAVTDETYRLKKYRGNLMWGVHLFDEASQAADRRSFRTARRRLDRRQQRIQLLQELLAPAILEQDPTFFLRLKESALLPEDFQYRTHDLYFNNKDYNDEAFHKEFPTVHHLICELMNNPAPHDVRIVYIACAYLLAHRGHFLREIDPDKVEDLLDFSDLYSTLRQWFSDNDSDFPFPDDSSDLKNIMLLCYGVTPKEKALKERLFNSKVPKDSDARIELSALIKLIAGGTVRLSALFCKESYTELEKDSVCIANSDFDERLPELSSQLDDGHCELLCAVKNIFDWSLLMGMLANEHNGKEPTVSAAKVKIYEAHQQDLKELKYISKSYLSKKQYDEIFRDESVANNYVWYSYHFKGRMPEKGKKAKQEDFCKFITGYLKNITPKKQDVEILDRLKEKAGSFTLCPKQVTTDNRVIPYQLNYRELKCILDNASGYIPLLSNKDEFGTVADKILSIMKFRIPYYVGPLVSEQKSDYAWMVRKAEGKIYPWNFDKMIDHEQSEEKFIRRMTCACSYLAGEAVLPKNSLLYSKFCVLNEINNLAVDGERIPVEAKQKLYDAKFLHSKRRVTKKAIRDFLCANGYMSVDQTLSGVDDTLKSSLKPYHDFQRLLSQGVLTEADTEEIIERITVTTDKKRLRKWLEEKYSQLEEADIRYLSNLNYQDYGRLSRRFLEDVFDVDVKTGELRSERNIITTLWETNENLMQLLSDRYGYSNYIASENQVYYNEYPKTIEQKMDDLYLPKPVRRAVTRTLDIMKELRSLLPEKPDRIFIEMARGGELEKKGKRTESRKNKIEKYLSEMRKEISVQDYDLLHNQLSGIDDNRLRSEKVFLYFMQLGRCMYSGEAISFDQIGNDALYNIDHIYPQSKTMDDSLDNKVLVLSSLNGSKSDRYPIDAEIRKKMHTFWDSLRKRDMISQKKYERLTRSTKLTEEELSGFVQRQLVETRQSTKAVAMLLKELFPDTEIVYVKAGLVSQFRHDLDMLKCREVNDLHHAKDAYLNIVIGNVYHERFTKRFFERINQEKYSLRLFEKQGDGKSRGLLTYQIKDAWDPETSFDTVKRMMSKNSIRYVRYCYRRKGGLFHQQPDRAKAGLIPRKKELNETEKYGGYNNSSASCFIPMKYRNSFLIVPLELMYADSFFADEDERKTYLLQILPDILGDDICYADIQLPFGKRIIKINTLLEVNGFRVNLLQKSNKGRTLVVSSAEPLVIEDSLAKYIKRLASFCEKSERGRRFQVTGFDGITYEENLRLFEWICSKCEHAPYVLFFSKIIQKVKDGKEVFLQLSITEQAVALLNLLSLLKTGRSAGCDLKAFSASGQAGIMTLNSDFSKIKSISDIRIIDQSPTGLIERRSENLLAL